MFKRILVPLDGSSLAEYALAPAMALARALEAEVLLLRSIPMVQPVFALPAVLSGEVDGELTRLSSEGRRQEAQDYLAAMRRRYECPGCLVHYVTPEGDPAAAIVDVAAEREVDLVVMSTHGQTGVRRAVFGSVTERVLHRVHCPTLVVRTPDPIRRVLITLDGSPLGERVLPPALAVARALGAQVILLRVNEAMLNPLEIGLMWDVEPMADEKITAQYHRGAERYLAALAAREGLSDEALVVLDGAAAERIEEFARLAGIDLIAMSTHGHSGLRRWLYGSVTTRVMRGGERSMLIVRPPSEALSG